MIQIEIKGCVLTPRWESLQTVLRESMNDEKFTLTRISRRDNGCHFRAQGTYDLTARTGDNSEVTIVASFYDHPGRPKNEKST